MFQTKPECAAAIRRLIHQLLVTMLGAMPEVSHIDLYAIAARQRQPGRGLAKYSLATSVTRDQHIKVLPVQDQPLTDWTDVCHSLRAGRCRLLWVKDFRPSPIRDRFGALEDSRILICPVIGPHADLLGAVCFGWSGRRRITALAESASMTVFARRIADQIARVMDLHAYMVAHPIV